MRRLWIVGLLGLGAVVAAGLLVLRDRPDAPGTPEPTASAPRARYQCSMHPEIVSDEPGICPICQMRLQRVDEAAVAPGERRPLFYRHPMRPDVTSPTPAISISVTSSGRSSARRM